MISASGSEIGSRVRISRVVDAAEGDHGGAGALRAEAREGLRVAPLEEGGDREHLRSGDDALAAASVDSHLEDRDSFLGGPGIASRLPSSTRYETPAPGAAPAAAASSSATAAAARSTCGSGRAPASKRAPSMPRTVRRSGRRPRARASSTASASPRAWVEWAASAAGSGAAAASKRCTVPGSAPELTASATDHRRRTTEGLDQVDRLALQLDHPEAGRGELAQPGGDQQPGGVVAAHRVADPDEEAHSRSISSRRKWVEQEMQGS